MPVTISELKKRFNRARISQQDFADAESYLQAYSLSQPPEINRALLLAATISYIIPFTDNAPGASATSRLSVKLAKVLTQKERALHEHLICLRNEALAHSEWSRKPVERVSGSSSGFVVQGRPFDILSERIDLEAFKALCAKMSRYCNKSLYALNSKICDIENAP